MSDTTPPAPVDDSSVLSGALPVVATFQPEPMQAPFGQAPESLLGKRLALARAHYGLNIEALSRLTKLYDEYGERKGISPASLNRYEAGDSWPGAREIRLLCESLGLTSQWLLFGDLGMSGESKDEQALLKAFKGFVLATMAQQADSPLSSPQYMQWSAEQLRAKRISEARKP